MWALIMRFLPGGRSIQMLAIVAVAAFALGAWSVYKFVKAAEVDALRAQIEEQKGIYAADLAGVESFYKGELERSKGRARVQEVIKYVPTDSDCSITGDAVRVLDNARQGLPSASIQTVTGAGEPAAPVGISERQLYRADADLADRFQSCRQQIRELGRWFDSLP